MCATVCPSQALHYGTRDEIERLRPRSTPIDTFRFGAQVIHTRVRMMVPRDDPPAAIDVLGALDLAPAPQDMAPDPLLANLYVEEPTG
jgi:hypothetical protein